MAIIANNKTFPTKFAIMVAQTCDLFVPPEYESDNEALWYELRDRLAEFQKMGMSADYETSMIAYYGYKLTDEQKEKLRFIHENTQKWLFGEVAEHVFTAIQKTQGKDAKELSELFLENFVKKKADSKTKKSLLVQFTGLTENEVRMLEDDGENDDEVEKIILE